MDVANSVLSASYYPHDDMMSFGVLSQDFVSGFMVGAIIFLRVLIKSLQIQHGCSALLWLNPETL